MHHENCRELFAEGGFIWLWGESPVSGENLPYLKIAATIKKACSRVDGEGCPSGDDQNGRLGARSDPLYGIVSKTQLPLGIFTAETQPAEGSMVKKLKPGPASARTILLVDDSPKEKNVRATMQFR
jgi:hypothetical protein